MIFYKIQNVTGLVTKKNYNAKISDTEANNFADSDYKKFSNEMLETKMKQKLLVGKCHISNLVKNSDLNTQLAALTTKTKVKAKKDNIVKV